jgi:hypothetical protein
MQPASTSQSQDVPFEGVAGRHRKKVKAAMKKKANASYKVSSG